MPPQHSVIIKETLVPEGFFFGLANGSATTAR
jgi:hypothetical protein